MKFGLATPRTFLLSILFVASWTDFASGHGHDCIHDKIQKEPPKEQHVNYKNHPWEANNDEKRRLLSGNTAPIRIHADFSVLEQDWQSKPNDVVAVKKAIGAVTRYLNRLLKVIPVEGPLRIARSCPSFWTSGPDAGKCAREPTQVSTCQGCNGNPLVTIPSSHLDGLTVYDGRGGVVKTYPAAKGLPNTDLVVYVTAKNCNCQGPAAWAGSCRSDQHGRPIAGAVNICSINVNDWSSSVMLLLHEIGHIFYMSNSLFKNYRDANGNKRTNPTTMIGSQPFLITPQVQKVARSHFSCLSLQGAPLESNGGSTASHWEKQHLFSEVLNPSLSGQNFMSEFSIAAMQDSGWYDVQLENADAFRFGLGAGCSFPTSNQCSAFPRYWCTTKSVSCAYNYKNFGPCSGSSSVYTNCNTVGRYSNWLPCTDSNQGQSGRNGGKGGSTSRCVDISSGNWPNTASCYPMTCNSYNSNTQKYASVTMTVGTKQVTCLRSDIGKVKKLQTSNGDAFTGDLTCPNFDTFCVGPNPFACVNGKHTGSRCFCQAGWKGSKCDTKDDAVWSPFPGTPTAPTPRPTPRPTPLPRPTTKQPTRKPTTKAPTSGCTDPSSGWRCRYTNYLQDCYFAANAGNFRELVANGFSDPKLLLKFCLTGLKPYAGWTEIKIWSSVPCGSPSWSRTLAQQNAPKKCATGAAGALGPEGQEEANNNNTEETKGLSGGAIAGIAVGATVVLACCVIGLVYFMRKRTSEHTNGYVIMDQ